MTFSVRPYTKSSYTVSCQAAAIMFILSCLTGCGQKGALYLPDNPKSPVVSPASQPTPASRQPAVSDNPQNPNVNSVDQSSSAQSNQGDTNDY